MPAILPPGAAAAPPIGDAAAADGGAGEHGAGFAALLTALFPPPLASVPEPAAPGPAAAPATSTPSLPEGLTVAAVSPVAPRVGAGAHGEEAGAPGATDAFGGTTVPENRSRFRGAQELMGAAEPQAEPGAKSGAAGEASRTLQASGTLAIGPPFIPSESIPGSSAPATPQAEPGAGSGAEGAAERQRVPSPSGPPDPVAAVVAPVAPGVVRSLVPSVVGPAPPAALTSERRRAFASSPVVEPAAPSPPRPPAGLEQALGSPAGAASRTPPASGTRAAPRSAPLPTTAPTPGLTTDARARTEPAAADPLAPDAATPRSAGPVAERPAGAEVPAAAPRTAALVAEAVTRAGELRRPVRIRLDPPELGSVQVEVAPAEGDPRAVRVRLTASDPAGRAVLAEALPRLREALAAAGLVVEAVDLDPPTRPERTGPGRRDGEPDRDPSGGGGRSDEGGGGRDRGEDRGRRRFVPEPSGEADPDGPADRPDPVAPGRADDVRAAGVPAGPLAAGSLDVAV